MDPTSSTSTDMQIDDVQLKTIEDRTPDKVHLRCDEEINDDIELLGEEVTLLALLFKIMDKARSDFTDRSYVTNRRAHELLKTQPLLVKELEDAQASREYKRIRNLVILIDSPPSSPNLGYATNPAAVAGMASAFSRGYIGSSHKLLLAAINGMDRKQAYSNTVSLLQSSGSGKSRMVHEQAALVFTLPFNLRSQTENKVAAFPPPDVEVSKYMTQVRPKEEWRRHFLIFFACLFSEVLNELRTWPPYTTEVQLAEAWRNYLSTNDNRPRIYKVVEERARKMVRDTNANDADKAASDHLNTLLSRLSGLCTEKPNASAFALDGHPRRKPTPSRLKKARPIDEHSVTEKPSTIKLMLYFDEAHVLTSTMEDFDGYDALCSSMNALLPHPVFAIFLSTNSSLTLLAPPIALARSARAREGHLQAPFTQTPFDCSPRFPIAPNAIKLAELHTVEYLAQFGRPLFWTMLEAGATTPDSIIGFARSKILRRSRLDKDSGYYPKEALTALIDILVMLEFEPLHSHNFEVDMVASHMRTAYSVPEHRAYLRSGYSSEPLLAEAAAQQVYAFQTKGEPDFMAATLSARFEEGLIAPGERGEVVMRVLLMEALMRAVVVDYIDEDKSLMFSEGCKLTTFIEELFAEDYVATVLGSYPDNLPGEQLKDSDLKDARVRFTHFVKAEDETVLGTTSLLAAFVRGMAYVGWQSQKEIDFAIPILLDSKKGLHPTNISVLLVQVKRRKLPGAINKYHIDSRNLAIFPKDNTSPYLTLVAELGVQSRKHEVEASQARKEVKERKAKKGQHTNPRYAIRAYGCSKCVYKGINTHSADRYAAILAMNPLYGEHPRQTHEELGALEEQKPAWTMNNSFRWYRHEGEEYHHEGEEMAVDT